MKSWVGRLVYVTLAVSFGGSFWYPPSRLTPLQVVIGFVVSNADKDHELTSVVIVDEVRSVRELAIS